MVGQEPRELGGVNAEGAKATRDSAGRSRNRLEFGTQLPWEAGFGSASAGFAAATQGARGAPLAAYLCTGASCLSRPTVCPCAV